MSLNGKQTFEQHLPLPQTTKTWHIADERINLTLEFIPVGSRDLRCTLFGGENHIGAVCVGTKQDASYTFKLIEIPTHREGQLAKDICTALCHHYQCTVVTVVGIHFDNITKEEITLVLDLSAKLLAKALGQ